MNQIDKQVTKTTTLSITAVRQNIDLNSEIFAVNWLDPKFKWMYNLYTLLARSVVKKVGGQLWHKSTHLEKLTGSDADGRKILLIVRYPSADKFMNLIGIKFFQLLSILRILAVENFVFGFTKRIKTEGLSKEKLGKGTPCLVHHFRCKKSFSGDLQAIAAQAFEKGINLVYSGERAATLSKTVVGKEMKSVPFFMDGIMVWEAGHSTALKAFFESDIYQNFRNELENSYAAIFRKIA